MRHPLRVMASTVLAFEAMVVFFGALVAKDLSSLSQGRALLGGAVLALLLLLTIGLLRSPVGYVLGSLLQIAIVATAFVVPAMLLVGIVFGALWFTALLLARSMHARTSAAAEGERTQWS